MLKFAANLTMLFNEVEFLDRFALARQAGFNFVEFLFPYDYEIEALQACIRDQNLQCVLFNLPPGNWEAGERGIACIPGRETEFREGVHHALQYAKALNVKQLNCLAGITPPNNNQDKVREVLLSNLKYASKVLQENGITLLIEAINSKVDMPGFYIDTLDKALEFQSLLKDNGVKIQLDFYHMQIMHGDLLRSFERHQKVIGHLQFADNPGRHEPGTGEINYAQIFARLEQLGYASWVSAEYRPSNDTLSSLGWLPSFN